jgi:hypothetical protein
MGTGNIAAVMIDQALRKADVAQSRTAPAISSTAKPAPLAPPADGAGREPAS